MPANTVIKIRRGNSGAWVTAQGVLGSTPVLAAGEFGYETDTNQIKVGDGTSVWGSLPYITGTGVPESTTRAYSDIVVSGVDGNAAGDVFVYDASSPESTFTILYGDNIAAQSGAGDTLQLSVTGLALADHLHSGLEFISGITPGIASATKALVVDSNLDIEGIRNLIIDGELTVRGETTIVESNVVQIGDNIIRVNVSGVSTGGLEVATPDDDLSFDITTSGSSFRIDGNPDPTLNLVKGQTYTFNINTPGHPFHIQTNAFNSYNPAGAYNSGVTNNGITSGTLVFVPPIDVPAELYYVSENNSAFLGNMLISDATTVSFLWDNTNQRWTFDNKDIYVPSGNITANTFIGNLQGNADSVTSGIYLHSTDVITHEHLKTGIILDENIADDAAISVDKLSTKDIKLGDKTYQLGETYDSISGVNSIVASGAVADNEIRGYTINSGLIDGGTP